MPQEKTVARIVSIFIMMNLLTGQQAANAAFGIIFAPAQTAAQPLLPNTGLPVFQQNV